MVKVSLRGLLAHKYRLVLTVIAVVVSVTFMAGTQVLTATISTSFDKVFDDVYKNYDAIVRSTNKIESNFGSYRAPIDAGVVDTVRKVPGVRAVEGQVQSQVSIIGKDGDPVRPAQGGPPTFGMNWLTEPALNGWHLSAGRAPEQAGEVVLDRASARTGGYAVGDTAKVQTNQGAQDMTVVGLAGFGTTEDFAGAGAALFDTATAQRLLVEPGKFTWVNVAGDDGISQEQLRARIAGTLPANTEAITGQAFTEESQDVFRKVFSVLGNVLLAFALVAAFVGTFIIYNTFSIIVAQRTQELALLRAMGASRRQVLGSVTLEATMVGTVASLLGLGVAVLLAKALITLISAGSTVQIGGLTYQPAAFISAFVVGLAITVGSALVPARRAAAVPPVAAMRAVAIDTTNESALRLWLGIALAVAGAACLYWGLFVTGDFKLQKTGAGIFLAMLGAIVLGPMFAQPMSRAIGAPLRSFNGRLARANAMRNPRRTAATASALMIGVALIVMFSVVIRSLQSSVDAGVSSAFTADVVIDSQSFGMTGIELGFADEVAKVPGVADVVGVEAGLVTIGNRPAQVLGADLNKLPTAIAITTVAGDLGKLHDNEIAVAKKVSEEKGVRLGSDFPMTVLQGGERLFKVGAIYDVRNVGNIGYLMTDKAFAATFPPMFQTYNQMYVKAAPGTSPAELRDRLRPVVKARFPTAVTQDLSEFAGAQAAQLDVMLLIINGLLILAIIIAGLGIINTLLLSVYERTREIGLLRAVGMARRQVRSVVRWESVIFSLQGTAVGIVIGFVFAWALVTAFGQQADIINLSIPWGLVIVLPVLAVVAAVVAAVVPAYSAAKLRVLDAIATE